MADDQVIQRYSSRETRSAMQQISSPESDESGLDYDTMIMIPMENDHVTPYSSSLCVTAAVLC